MNLEYIWWLYICYSQLGQEGVAAQYQAMYYGFIDAIINSGDGLDCHTSFTVISAKHEYEVLAVFGFESQGQSPAQPL